jgi:hypothetical protein
MNMNLNAVNRQPTFQLQNGQLDVQAKQFIKQFDTDLDGSLSQEEVGKSSGLMGAVQTKVSSPQLAQALWASIAGPTNTINAKEYAAFLLGVDADRNGMITQAEADAYVAHGSQAFKNLGLKEGVKGMYQTIISNGNQVGLDKAFGTTEEEQFALEEVEPQGLQSVSAPESSLVNPKTQLMGLLTESPDAPTGAEWGIQLINQALMQMSNTVNALFSLTADLDRNSPQYASLKQRLEKILAIVSTLEKQKETLNIFQKQINAELDKQGVTVKSPQLPKEFTEQLNQLFMASAKEEPESPAYQSIMAKLSQRASQEYTLLKKANPDYVRVVQEISNKNKADILSGKINAENLPEVEKDTVTTVDGILTILPTLPPSTTPPADDDIGLPLV